MPVSWLVDVGYVRVIGIVSKHNCIATVLLRSSFNQKYIFYISGRFELFQLLDTEEGIFVVFGF